SEISRSVRVAVTTTRSNSVALADALASAAVSAEARRGNASASAAASRVGRMRVSCRSGVVVGAGLAAASALPVAGGPWERWIGRQWRARRRPRAGAPTPPGLLGEDQLVVAGVAQPVPLVAVADAHFALPLQQAQAVDLGGRNRRCRRADGFDGVRRRFDGGLRQEHRRVLKGLRMPMLIILILLSTGGSVACGRGF